MKANQMTLITKMGHQSPDAWFWSFSLCVLAQSRAPDKAAVGADFTNNVALINQRITRNLFVRSSSDATIWMPNSQMTSIPKAQSQTAPTKTPSKKAPELPS
jgi:hypothetical protein